MLTATQSIAPTRNEIIDRTIREIGAQTKAGVREVVWAGAERAALQPRHHGDQRYAGVLYSKANEPLVYRAFNQIDLRGDSKLVLIHRDGFTGREVQVLPRKIDFVRWAGEVVEDEPMYPLTTAEEIVVCRKLIRRYAQLRRNKVAMIYISRSHVDHLLATEIVRLRNARAA